MLNRETPTGIERRFTAAPRVPAVARVAARRSGQASSTLAGYAAVFHSETIIAGVFRERILPGAFTASIREHDVVALFNHDPNFILGRTANRTVRLSEDATGLRYSVDLNEKDPEAMRVGRIVTRGDIRGSSFAFSVDNTKDEDWDFSGEKTGQLPLRTVKRARLFDVSVVTQPAYATTTATVNANSLAQPRAGVPTEILERDLELLELEVSLLPRCPGGVRHRQPDRWRAPIEILERDLELLELEVSLLAYPQSW